MTQPPTPPPIPPWQEGAAPLPARSLAYSSTAVPTAQRFSTGRQIVIAFLVGCAVSGVAYPLLWGNSGNAAVIAALTLLGVKFIAGVTLLCFRGKRGYGGGLLASLAVGFVIFFFTCAAKL